MLKKTLLTASLACFAFGAGNALAQDIEINNDTARVIAVGGNNDTDFIQAYDYGQANGVAGRAIVGSVDVSTNCDCEILVNNLTRDVVAVGSSVVGSVRVSTW